MKLKILIGVLVFLILVNLATIGSYVYHVRHRGDERGPFGPGMPGSPLMEQLSPEQRQKMKESVDKFMEDTREPAETIRKLEEETMALLHNDTVPRARVDANLEKLSALRLEMSRRAVQRLIDTKSFLTPPQQEIFFRGIFGAQAGPPPGHQPGDRQDPAMPGRPPFDGHRPPGGSQGFGPPPGDGHPPVNDPGRH